MQGSRSPSEWGHKEANPPPTSARGARRTVTEQDLQRLCTSTLPVDEVYIGSGAEKLGIPRSKWATPFRYGPDEIRDVPLLKYKDYLDESGLVRAVEELEGITLLCECGAAEGCH